jgi:hypothetical protein
MTNRGHLRGKELKQKKEGREALQSELETSASPDIPLSDRAF